MNTQSMKEATIQDLRASAKAGTKSATVSLFVNPTRDEPVDRIAKRLIGEAGVSDAVDIVQVHPLAGSFSVRGDPDAIARLVQKDEIEEALCGGQQSDPYPKPVKRRSVDIEDDEGLVEYDPPGKKPPPSRKPSTERRSPGKRR